MLFNNLELEKALPIPPTRRASTVFGRVRHQTFTSMIPR